MLGILYAFNDILGLSTRFVCVEEKVHLLISFIPDEDCHEFKNEELAAIAQPCDGVSCKKGVTYPIHESFYELLEKHGCTIERESSETGKKLTGKDAVLGLKYHFPGDRLARTTAVGLLPPSRLT